MKPRFFSLLIVLLLIFVLCAGGCGGGKKKTYTPTEPEVTDTQPAEPEPPIKKAPKKKKEETAEVKEAVEEALPEDFSAWTREHFLRAKREKIQNTSTDLTPAITILAARGVGTNFADEDAEILAELLRMELPPDFEAEIAATEEAKKAAEAEEAAKKPKKKPADDSDDEDDEDADFSDDQESSDEEAPVPPENLPPVEITLTALSQKEITAAVQGLLENNSTQARKTVQDILRRKLMTDDDRTAIQTIVVKIAETPTPENEKLLFRILTASDEMRPAETEEAKAALKNRLDGGKERKNAEGRRVNIRTVGGSGRGTDFTPQEMRNLAMEQVRKNATPAFRLEIANFLMNTEAAPAGMAAEDLRRFAESLLQFIMEKKPENLDAQLALYQSKTPDAALKTRLEEILLPIMQETLRTEFLLTDEKTLTDYRTAIAEQKAEKERAAEAASGESTPEAVSLLGGLGSANSGTSGNTGSGSARRTDELSLSVRMLLDAELREKTTETFWADAQVNAIKTRFQNEMSATLASLAKGELPAGAGNTRQDDRPMQMLMLVPRGNTRQLFYQLFTQAWELGPAEMTKLGLLDKYETEPGFLMVIKSLERKDPVKVKKNAPLPKQPTTAQAQKEKRQKAAGDWMIACDSQLKKWCETFASAGKTQSAVTGKTPELTPVKNTDDKPTGEAKLTGFPLPLPANAEIVSFYTKTWKPTGTAETGTTLRISFVRLKCTSKWTTIQSFFKKNAKGAVLRDLDAADSQKITTLWMEKFELNEKNIQESVDVRISPITDGKVGGNIDLKSTATTEMQIDILIMEMEKL